MLCVDEVRASKTAYNLEKVLDQLKGRTAFLKDCTKSCTIYTSNPGAWIGVKGKNVKELKNMLSKAKSCDVEVKFIQIKGEILSL